MTRGPASGATEGFSLLEMLVAVAVLGLVLGTLYQAASSATRTVRVAERYSYATLLAQSVLADHAGRADRGYRSAGTAGDYRWVLTSQPLQDQPAAPGTPEVPLQWLRVEVYWGDTDSRSLHLTTVAPYTQEVAPP